MGIVDRLKNFMGYSEDDYDEEEGTNDMNESDIDPDNDVINFTNNQQSPNKVVNIHATTQLQVVLVKPERFEDAAGIADHLNAKRTIVLNLEGASREVTRRLIDFLSGVAYANNGQIKRVANSTYIITPYNVGIMGDLLDELESSGVFL